MVSGPKRTISDTFGIVAIEYQDDPTGVLAEGHASGTQRSLQDYKDPSSREVTEVSHGFNGAFVAVISGDVYTYRIS